MLLRLPHKWVMAWKASGLAHKLSDAYLLPTQSTDPAFLSFLTLAFHQIPWIWSLVFGLLSHFEHCPPPPCHPQALMSSFISLMKAKPITPILQMRKPRKGSQVTCPRSHTSKAWPGGWVFWVYCPCSFSLTSASQISVCYIICKDQWKRKY